MRPRFTWFAGTIAALLAVHCGSSTDGALAVDGGSLVQDGAPLDDGDTVFGDGGSDGDARDGGTRDGSTPKGGDASTTSDGSADASGACPSCIGTHHFIATGDYHSCALKSGAAYCWGKNDVGQLGNGLPADSNVPVAVTSPGVAFASIAAGFQNTCAVDVHGGVWCWGGGEVSGAAYDTITRTPVSIAMPAAASSVAVGSRFACALLVDHRVACWGINGWGQFGVAISGTVLTATIMPLTSNAVALGAGEFFTCVLTTTGTVCMGEDSHGELGDGTLSGGWTVPRAVTNIGTSITQLGVGLFHSCAVLTDGGAACWGTNTAGEVGPSGYDSNDIGFPVPALAAAPVLVAAGGFHSCLLRADGVLDCWGANYHGVLGRGTDTSQELIGPVLSAPSNVSELSLGRYHSCAWQEGVGAWCWGDSSSGQVGKGVGQAFTTPQFIGP